MERLALGLTLAALLVSGCGSSDRPDNGSSSEARATAAPEASQDAQAGALAAKEVCDAVKPLLESKGIEMKFPTFFDAAYKRAQMAAELNGRWSDLAESMSDLSRNSMLAIESFPAAQGAPAGSPAANVYRDYRIAYASSVADAKDACSEVDAARG